GFLNLPPASTVFQRTEKISEKKGGGRLEDDELRRRRVLILRKRFDCPLLHELRIWLPPRCRAPRPSSPLLPSLPWFVW
ncbi:hypothetical protein U1Q18_015044, partial [Sarracenia purpurea var. burkii]